MTRDELDAVAQRLVSDLHAPRPAVYWADLLLSATVGWTAFAVALVADPLTPRMLVAVVVAGTALYRGLIFTHELTHLRRRSLPGFETAWNILFGVPLLLPSFTYVGVHQTHHNLSTYGTKGDPEYLPFANSRSLLLVFAAQSSLLTPVVLPVRFLLVAPVGLLWPRFHRWLEAHASSFAMNPAYRRSVTAAGARKMRIWETAMLAAWAACGALVYRGTLPYRIVLLWCTVVAFVSALNTARVLAAHEYEPDGGVRDRTGQVRDSLDTPGGPWTELWAPVGLRYHALHHYFPGIPYHNLGIAYRRIVGTEPCGPLYQESTSPSLWHSLKTLYQKASRRAAALAAAW